MRLVCALASGLIVLLALAAACGDDSTEPSGPYTETLHFTRAGHDVTLDVAVADELEERVQGLMNVPSLPDDAGMLFVFPTDTLSGFWMKDTVISLSIAFVTLWGVVFPLISEVFKGRTVTIAAPFYNQVNGPLMLALILFMGVGPLLPWRKATLAG